MKCQIGLYCYCYAPVLGKWKNTINVALNLGRTLWLWVIISMTVAFWTELKLEVWLVEVKWKKDISTFDSHHHVGIHLQVLDVDESWHSAYHHLMLMIPHLDKWSDNFQWWPTRQQWTWRPIWSPWIAWFFWRTSWKLLYQGCAVMSKSILVQ